MSSSANVEATLYFNKYNLPLAKTGPKEVILKDKYGAIVEVVVDHKRSFRAVRIVGLIIEDIAK